MLKDFFETWKNVINTINLQSEWRDIVFYSEGPWLTSHFNPLIKELCDGRSKKVTLLTSSTEDKVNLSNKNNLKTIYIGSESARTYLFRKFNAKLVIMSTPNLQNMQLKKEKGTKYYYLHHSPCSTHMIYEDNAFDHFEGMFCIGPYQKNEVLEREMRNPIYKKNLLESGYPNFDNLKKYFNNESVKGQILIAPTWGENSITNLCLHDLINKLIDLKYNIILRPHNRSYIKNKKKLLNVIKSFEGNKYFKIDSNPDSSESMNKSEILITDWSGISFEYMIQSKPILFIDTPPKVNNKNYKNSSNIPLEVSMRNKIGESINFKEINSIDPEILERKINDALSKVSNNKKFIKDNFYNFGNSVTKICNQIEKIK